jgi:hypothetical protein
MNINLSKFFIDIYFTLWVIDKVYILSNLIKKKKKPDSKPYPVYDIITF